ncbi:hypothetical protein [Streptomyces sp. NBC_01481]|uniref:hypothetical protein n=1 Tax=Streptomyces sp. NBC_01481 TaxID=2975869 RepID=UPI00225877DC|nr:hypothetical protein [Streptomyces sp. NBC_01481]MCX4586363.1 hypothetical protein [Streptomyces sp. NBC_01481]
MLGELLRGSDLEPMDLLVAYRDAIVAGAIRHDGACVSAMSVVPASGEPSTGQGDVRQRDRETLKDASAHLLQALGLTRDELSRVSAEMGSTTADRASAAHRAFRENQLYGRLYQRRHRVRSAIKVVPTPITAAMAAPTGAAHSTAELYE